LGIPYSTFHRRSTSVAGTVAAKLKRNDNGTAFRVADHFKACWRNQDKAEELYCRHRSALREDRGLSPLPPCNESEAEIIERLANLSLLVDGGQNVPGQGNTLSAKEGAPVLRQAQDDNQGFSDLAALESASARPR
jgi:hypothetical protein